MSDVAQPGSPSAPRLAAEPNRNDRRSTSPGRRSSEAISPASALPLSMIIVLDPHLLLPDDSIARHTLIERLLRQRLPSHGPDRPARAFARVEHGVYETRYR